MDEPHTLGDVIRSRRLALQLTQEELAERIGDGVRQAEVSRLERGRVTLPRRRRLERIAAALDLSLGELLAHAGWAGTDSAFRPAIGDADRQPPTSEEFVEQKFDLSRHISGAVVSAQLRAALERSRLLQERTAELLQRSTSLAARWNAGEVRRPPSPGA